MEGAVRVVEEENDVSDRTKMEDVLLRGLTPSESLVMGVVALKYEGERTVVLLA